MLQLLIRYAIAAACVLFMVSLPIGKWESGAALRRWSAVLLLAAFAPYVFTDIVRALSEGSPRRTYVATPMISAAGVLEVIGVCAVLAPVAYLVLVLRKHFAHGSKEEAHKWSHVRSSGKRPVEHGDAPHAPLFDDDEES
jgi:hypothetical protein